MSSSDRLPWGRLVAEDIVIVLGILLALGADAWWDDRQEREAEQTALRQLRAEFESNSIQFDSIMALHRQHLSAAETMLQIHRAGTSISSDSLRALILPLDRPGATAGALNSVIASGRPEIIQDDSLRVELAAWPGLVEVGPAPLCRTVRRAPSSQPDLVT